LSPDAILGNAKNGLSGIKGWQRSTSEGTIKESVQRNDTDKLLPHRRSVNIDSRIEALAEIHYEVLFQCSRIIALDSGLAKPPTAHPKIIPYRRCWTITMILLASIQVSA
jgi:hypothetical protein